MAGAQPGLACNLRLSDPIAEILARADGEGDGAGGGWSGIGGDYLLAIGESSGVESGHDPSLPTLMASVGVFTRC